jgi:hypothetical protein
MKTVIQAFKRWEHEFGSGRLEDFGFFQDADHFCCFLFDARVLVNTGKVLSGFADPPQVKNKRLESSAQFANCIQRPVGILNGVTDGFLNLTDRDPPRFLIHGWSSPKTRNLHVAMGGSGTIGVLGKQSAA